MSRRLPAALACALTVAATAVIGTALPAQAALSCAPDSYEAADAGTGVLIPVGGTVTRAICQDRDAGVDREFFSFDAVGGKAYSAAIISAGSGLAFGQLNGLQVAGVFKVNADGTRGDVVDSPNAESYERFTTPILPAGRYSFVAVDGDEVAYPDNYLGTKPVDGQAGVYTMKVEQAANPAPGVSAITVPKDIKPQSRPTGSTYTLSGPAPVGGLSLYITTSSPYVSVDRIWVPAGATRGSFIISSGRAIKGQTVVFTATTRVGTTATASTLVK